MRLKLMYMVYLRCLLAGVTLFSGSVMDAPKAVPVLFGARAVGALELRLRFYQTLNWFHESMPSSPILSFCFLLGPFFVVQVP